MVAINVGTVACQAFSLLNFFASTIVSKLPDDYNFSKTDIRPNSTFDFIIVGAGSAGCVLANRLSENPNWKVLLLEAGCNNVLLEQTPSANSVLLSLIDQKCIWSDTTVRHADIQNGAPIFSPAGRTLGGSGTISASSYSRGNKKDFDNFAARGNTGWDYESVLPYFKKSEQMSDPELAKSSYHSTKGPMRVTVSDYRDDAVINGIKKAFEDTLDLPETDYNGENQVGIGFSQHLLRDGRKETAKSAYLRPVLYRQNLVIKTFSLVTRVILDPDTRKAKGVEFVHEGVKTSVFASKEVILSAGTVRSPQILMLSGIGPQDHLESHGIKVIRDLPVGKNLRDHVVLLPTFPLEIYAKGAPKFVSAPAGSSSQILRPSQVLTAFKSFRSGDPSWPDIMMVTVLPINFKGCLKSIRALLTEVLVIPVLVQPKSVGEIRLGDTNPLSDPKIDPRYLSRQQDVEALTDALKFLLRLNNSEALNKAGLKFKGVPPSLCCLDGKKCIENDEYWECVVRTFSTSAFSLYGSCKMGPDTDPEAVVDPQLRVKGLKNLRVVDASALPSISGNILAPVVMMAEKASDLIKNEWGPSKMEDSDEEVRTA